MPNQFIKKCPKCGNDQFYSCKRSLTLAMKNKTLCNKCRASFKKITPPNGIWKRTCGKEMIYSCRYSFNTGNRTNAVCRNCATSESSKHSDKSVFKTKEYRNKQSEMMKKARQTDSFGELFKEKCRMNKLKKIQEQGVAKTYNEEACKFIDKINEMFGYKLQHALNGGEVNVSGFSLDGYDKEKNVVFEYDEPKHNKKCQIEKDKYRQQIIIDKLKPVEFLRFNEECGKLVDILSRKELL
jgi:hypothetical protein